MASDDHVRDGIASSDLYLAVMASDDDTVTRFHEHHRNAVIGYVNRVRAIIRPHSSTCISSHILAAELYLHITPVLHSPHLWLRERLGKIL